MVVRNIGEGRVRIALRHIGNVSLIHVIGFNRDVPLVVELMVIGAAQPLQIVVTPVAVVHAVSAEVDIVPGIVAFPLDAAGVGRLCARVPRALIARIAGHGIDERDVCPVPRNRFRAGADAKLQLPVFGQLESANETGVRVIVERVGHRVRVRIIVRRELRLDVRQRDIAPDTDLQPLRHRGHIDFAIDHRHVVAGKMVAV